MWNLFLVSMYGLYSFDISSKHNTCCCAYSMLTLHYITLLGIYILVKYMYTTYLREDKKIGMYKDFGVLCTRYLISGWDFPRILFWKRSNLAKKVSNFRPSQYPAIESWTSFTYKIRKGLSAHCDFFDSSQI